MFTCELATVSKLASPIRVQLFSIKEAVLLVRAMRAERDDGPYEVLHREDGRCEIRSGNLAVATAWDSKLDALDPIGVPAWHELGQVPHPNAGWLIRRAERTWLRSDQDLERDEYRAERRVGLIVSVADKEVEDEDGGIVSTTILHVYSGLDTSDIELTNLDYEVALPTPAEVAALAIDQACGHARATRLANHMVSVENDPFIQWLRLDYGPRGADFAAKQAEWFPVLLRQWGLYVTPTHMHHDSSGWYLIMGVRRPGSIADLLALA